MSKSLLGLHSSLQWGILAATTLIRIFDIGIICYKLHLLQIAKQLSIGDLVTPPDRHVYIQKS